ncbi:MAG: cysteine--tRNA ligase [Candidatus Methanosuratincola sp.]
MQVFNTKSGSKEELITTEPGTVKAYICGPTVYDYCHIGHARTYINFDVFRRYLEALGYVFVHVQNFTDIDDKITERAVAQRKTTREIAEYFIQEYFKDMDSLGIKRATVYTKVSEFVPRIAEETARLLGLGFAYRSGGAIYFDVQKAGGFGELVSEVQEAVTDKIESGSKKGPFDFTLWRQGKEGEETWDSPLGRGRPGWHIQCVVMSTDSLGPGFDVHWGGIDLIYPHHECEALLSRAMFGKVLARYWMHNNFVLMGGDKMSKSLGHSVYIRDVLERFSGSTVRTFLLQKHYREKIDYSEAGLEGAERRLQTLRDGARIARRGRGEGQMSVCVKDYADMFFGSLDDDLRTGEALTIAERLAWEMTEGKDKDFTGAWRIFDAVEGILGIGL